jgi:hypothetical protein
MAAHKKETPKHTKDESLNGLNFFIRDQNLLGQKTDGSGTSAREPLLRPASSHKCGPLHERKPNTRAQIYIPHTDCHSTALRMHALSAKTIDDTNQK